MFPAPAFGVIRYQVRRLPSRSLHGVDSRRDPSFRIHLSLSSGKACEKVLWSRWRLSVFAFERPP